MILAAPLAVASSPYFDLKIKLFASEELLKSIIDLLNSNCKSVNSVSKLSLINVDTFWTSFAESFVALTIAFLIVSAETSPPFSKDSNMAGIISISPLLNNASISTPLKRLSNDNAFFTSSTTSDHFTLLLFKIVSGLKPKISNNLTASPLLPRNLFFNPPHKLGDDLKYVLTFVPNSL